MEQARLLPGDLLDIAFALEENEHPEFGGIELSLRDFQRVTIEDEAARSSAAPN